MDETEICARCKFFPLQTMTPEQRATGVGFCGGYEKPTTWDTPPRPCVLYGEPRNRLERHRRQVYIDEMEARNAGTENAVDTAPGT